METEETFKQPCGCSMYGPGRQCKEGKALYKAMARDSKKLYDEKMSVSEADKSLSAWQGHLGA